MLATANINHINDLPSHHTCLCFWSISQAFRFRSVHMSGFVYRGYQVFRGGHGCIQKGPWPGLSHWGKSVRGTRFLSFIVVNGVYLDGTSKVLSWIFNVCLAVRFATKLSSSL